MRKALLLSFAYFTVLASCKKDNDTPASESKTTILAKASWKLSSYGVDTNMDGVLTGTENETKACNSDDMYTFTSSGSATYNPGSVKCGSEASFTTTWQFYQNEAKLDFFGDSYDIKILTENKLELHRVGPASIAIRILTR